MDAIANRIPTVLDYLRYATGQDQQFAQASQQPFILRQGQPPAWSDANLHQSAWEQNPELYALCSIASMVPHPQRQRILFQILKASHTSLTPEVRHTLERVSNILLAILPTEQVLTIFLALRRERANHKHTSRAILRYILNHPNLAELAVGRRPTLVDCLEHALGRNVARACAKAETNPTYIQRHLLKWAKDPAQVKEIFPALYQKGKRAKSTSAPEQLTSQFAQRLEPAVPRPTTVTATNRGDISATLVHLYRGGISVELRQALENYVVQAAETLPKFDGKLALVLDASASTRGYGEREFCNISQSVALKLVLKQCCSNLQVYTVGDRNEIPIPSGSTDLAGALLDALESQPDMVAIVSDGYENAYPGDLARVAATLPQAGIQTPVVFCHSKFTKSDDLTWRRPATNLPQLEFWHQDDFEPLMVSLLALADGKASETSLKEYLLRKIGNRELREQGTGNRE